MAFRPYFLVAGMLAMPGAAVAFTYFNPADTANVPRLLSQTGLYRDLQGKTLTEEAQAYEVNAPQWSDGAFKRRWIILRPGRSVPYREGADFLDYPDSTVFAETFLLEKVLGDSTTRVHWETRLLVKKLDTALSPRRDWYGFSYRWNAAQTDAALVARNPFNGFDTVFHLVDGGRQTYRKWRFPSSFECGLCHRAGTGTDSQQRPLAGRAVLGFLPAQLKRAVTGTGASRAGAGTSGTGAGGEQILDLFNRGVFSGTRPGTGEMAARFKGMREPLPAAGDARFWSLDTMARSYLAANCSGCHGTRGMGLGAADASELDLDFHDLRPRMELGGKASLGEKLNDTAAFNPAARPEGRYYFVLAVAKGGMDTAAGRIWDMALPLSADPENDLKPALVYPGYPSLSTLLFKQWARVPAWSDSARTRRKLVGWANSGDSATEAMARERLAWMFSQPWGSRPWLDTLAHHGFTADSVTDGNAWESDTPKQMPPLAASFVPDTAALRLLGEWVRQYRSGNNSGVKGTLRTPRGSTPILRHRLLLLPPDWTGRASMRDIQGRPYPLRPQGRGAYVLPAHAPAGVYFFRIGEKSFPAAVMPP